MTPGPEGDGESWQGTTAGDPDRARLLFRYLGGEEWQEYRKILAVFAGTFFAEFTPDDVASTTGIAPDVARDRLESLRRWCNLTVSSSVGNPSSLDDYYRRRNRYLITRSGQEVFELVEQVLAAADEIGDVQARRLRDLHRALEALEADTAPGTDSSDGDLVDTVRTVFDVHERFTTELTKFFAELNEWQNRYDLDPEQVQLFASVLVDYVSEQLTEIERMVAPIARSLRQILRRLDDFLPALDAGLASRVDDAGLADSVAVRALPGSKADDWNNLAAWFLTDPGRSSRLDDLTRQAMAAVRTLTSNVSRLSRLGVGAESRRSDFIRLAGFFDRAASVEQAARIAAAAFGLGSCRRLGSLSPDADDPVPTVTAWRDAPRSAVPVSLRERGETTLRGSATPVRDRRKERRLIERQRAQARVARANVVAELLSCADEDGRINDAQLSRAAFEMLRDLIGRSSHGVRIADDRRSIVESGVRCEVARAVGEKTVVTCPDGQLSMLDLVVIVVAEDSSVVPRVFT
ncbi:MAG: TIGR02677 family protein [Acidimicrobiaceae bacterium]|nr:TIGR02677 family protein [Acidimicrobiaceae bacterium]MYG55811.1 TIGR02677 family protein [Acidimicrobiaceae bacterium]MYJ97931.1 TIGR02677 family protein [Acidimicrobiaceae bacterium]